MFDPMLVGGEPSQVALTLYTDAFVVRGTIRTRQRRLTDILNEADEPFLVVSAATVDEYGAHNIAVRTRLRPGQPRIGPVRRLRNDGRASAGPADAEGARRWH